MSYQGGQDPNWQGQQGQSAYPPNPQDPYGQNASGQNPYGQQPAYPPNPYGQPQQYPHPPYRQQPPQYGQPYPPNAYGQPMPGYPYAQAQAPARPKETNPYARQAIIYGAIALVVVIVAFFLNYYIVGFLALYAVYAGIRASLSASKSPHILAFSSR